MSGPRIFDRRLLRQRQRRAVALGAATFLVDRVADELADRLSAVMRVFPLAVDLGTPTGPALSQSDIDALLKASRNG